MLTVLLPILTLTEFDLLPALTIGQYDGCRMRSRICLPFRSTWYHSRFLWEFVLPTALVLSVICSTSFLFVRTLVLLLLSCLVRVLSLGFWLLICPHNSVGTVSSTFYPVVSVTTRNMTNPVINTDERCEIYNTVNMSLVSWDTETS